MAMRFVLILGFGAWLSLGFIQASACSCIGPDNFFASLGNQTLEVEFLGFEQHQIMHMEARGEYTLAKVKVLKCYAGDADLDTLFIVQDKGFECFQGLELDSNASSYIITTVMDDFYPFQLPDSMMLKHKFIFLDLCSEPQVNVYPDGWLKGNFDRNKYNEARKKLRSLERSGSIRSERFSKKIHARGDKLYWQKMKRTQFEKELNRRYETKTDQKAEHKP